MKSESFDTCGPNTEHTDGQSTFSENTFQPSAFRHILTCQLVKVRSKTLGLRLFWGFSSLVDKHSHLRHLNRVEKTGQQLCGMKGAVERIFRQNILIGWESLFSVKGEAVNQIAQIVKSPTFVLQIFNILVLEDFGHKLISQQWSYWAWYKKGEKGR